MSILTYHVPDVTGLTAPERWRAALDRVARGLTVLGEPREPIVADLADQRLAALAAVRRAEAACETTAGKRRERALARLAEARAEVAWCDGQIELQRRAIAVADRRA